MAAGNTQWHTLMVMVGVLTELHNTNMAIHAQHGIMTGAYRFILNTRHAQMTEMCRTTGGDGANVTRALGVGGMELILVVTVDRKSVLMVKVGPMDPYENQSTAM